MGFTILATLSADWSPASESAGWSEARTSGCGCVPSTPWAPVHGATRPPSWSSKKESAPYLRAPGEKSSGAFYFLPGSFDGFADGLYAVAMASRVGRAVTIFALCGSIGFHWVALQSVAWATMLVANARCAPLSEAVSKTFDGAHPCDLCHAVMEGKKSEKKSEAMPTIAKLDLICTTRTLTCPPPSTPSAYAAYSCSIPERSLAPPAPPPRPLLG